MKVMMIWIKTTTCTWLGLYICIEWGYVKEKEKGERRRKKKSKRKKGERERKERKSKRK